jgi:hypothetical protein
MNGIEFQRTKRMKVLKKSPYCDDYSNEDSDKINAYNLNVAGYILNHYLLKNSFSVATLKDSLCEM